MKLLIEIDVEVVDEDEVKDMDWYGKYCDKIINEDEYWNNDFYYDFGDDVNKKINKKLKKLKGKIGVIESWRIK